MKKERRIKLYQIKKKNAKNKSEKIIFDSKENEKVNDKSRRREKRRKCGNNKEKWKN